MAIRIPDDDQDKTTTVFRRPDTVGGPRHEIAHYVLVIDGSEAGKKLELGLKPVRLGRRSDNDLVFSDRFVSGHHCTVSFEAGNVWVTDHGSTNGTFIDGKRITGRAIWPDNESLQLGNQVLCHEYRARDEIERSSQLVSDVHQAAEYVKSLLPPPLESGPVTADWHYAPCAELGGDVFNYHWLDDARFAFYLIDVCGHGVGAALHSVSVSNLLRQRALAHVDFSRPAEVLDALNRALPMEQYASMYFTLWYGVYRIGTQTLDYASAGHPPALLFSRCGRSLACLATDNPPIGVLQGVRFRQASVALEMSSSLYLYSDGVFEITQPGGDGWCWKGFARYLQQLVQAGHGQTEGVYQAIRAMTPEGAFEDDFSLLRIGF